MSDISRSHRIRKKSINSRPIIMRFIRHNTKFKILQKRWVLKEKKWPFSLQEYLTQQRCNILKYLHETRQDKVHKVWTVDGAIFFRPTKNEALVEKCSTFKDCKRLLISTNMFSYISILKNHSHPRPLGFSLGQKWQGAPPCGFGSRAVVSHLRPVVFLP